MVIGETFQNFETSKTLENHEKVLSKIGIVFLYVRVYAALRKNLVPFDRKVLAVKLTKLDDNDTTLHLC